MSLSVSLCLDENRTRHKSGPTPLPPSRTERWFSPPQLSNGFRKKQTRHEIFRPNLPSLMLLHRRFLFFPRLTKQKEKMRIERKREEDDERSSSASSSSSRKRQNNPNKNETRREQETKAPKAIQLVLHYYYYYNNLFSSKSGPIIHWRRRRKWISFYLAAKKYFYHHDLAKKERKRRLRAESDTFGNLICCVRCFRWFVIFWRRRRRR